MAGGRRDTRFTATSALRMLTTMYSRVAHNSKTTPPREMSIQRFNGDAPRHLESAREPVLDADATNDDFRMIVLRSRAAVLRYKWLTLAIVAMSGLAAFAIRGRFSPVYESEGKL